MKNFASCPSRSNSCKSVAMRTANKDEKESREGKQKKKIKKNKSQSRSSKLTAIHFIWNCNLGKLAKNGREVTHDESHVWSSFQSWTRLAIMTRWWFMEWKEWKNQLRGTEWKVNKFSQDFHENGILADPRRRFMCTRYICHWLSLHKLSLAYRFADWFFPSDYTVKNSRKTLNWNLSGTIS